MGEFAFDESAIGRSIFLTREEAEAALAALEGKKHERRGGLDLWYEEVPGVNEKHRKDYIKDGRRFIECALCGQRFNAGHVGTGVGPRWHKALKNEWWAKHTGQEKPAVARA